MNKFFNRPQGSLWLVLPLLLLLLGFSVDFDFSLTQGKTLFMFRLFRGLTALVTGGALAVSGLIFQTVFRNPLADPYILGISSGAAAGAAAVFVFFPPALLLFFVPAGALAGALATLAFVLFISHCGKDSSDKLLLSGVVTGVIVSSLLIYLISVSDSQQLAGVTWWTLGDLQGSSGTAIALLGSAGMAVLFLLRFYANELNLLALGEETAAVRGVPVRQIRLLFVIAASLLAAGCVALAGIIGFAGLVVPHIVRLLAGSDLRKSALLTYPAGGCFLLLCDRTASALSDVREMPVGVVSSCLGGGLFLFLLMRQKRGW